MAEPFYTSGSGSFCLGIGRGFKLPGLEYIDFPLFLSCTDGSALGLIPA